MIFKFRKFSQLISKSTGNKQVSKRMDKNKVEDLVLGKWTWLKWLAHTLTEAQSKIKTEWNFWERGNRHIHKGNIKWGIGPYNSAGCLASRGLKKKYSDNPQHLIRQVLALLGGGIRRSGHCGGSVSLDEDFESLRSQAISAFLFLFYTCSLKMWALSFLCQLPCFCSPIMEGLSLGNTSSAIMESLSLGNTSSPTMEGLSLGNISKNKLFLPQLPWCF